MPTSLKHDFFTVLAERVSKGGKERCGDSLGVDYIEDENILLLVVADGVSSCPCDWKASEVACEAALARFKKLSEGTIAQRIAKAAEKAHDAVRQIGGPCAGSITSLTFVAWEIGKEHVYYTNIGDSRLYIGPEDDLTQVTSDDIQHVLLKRNGEVVLNAGAPVFMRGVTRSLGQVENLDIDVNTHPFGRTDLLVLVSDGITKNDAFANDIPSIFGSPKIEEKLEQFVKANSSRNKDDATFVALYRTDEDISAAGRYEECVNNWTDFRSHAISRSQAVEYMKKDLSSKILLNANDDVNRRLDYAKEYDIQFDRNFLSGFLSSVIKQETDRDLVFRLRELIKRT